MSSVCATFCTQISHKSNGPSDEFFGKCELSELSLLPPWPPLLLDAILNFSSQT